MKHKFLLILFLAPLGIFGQATLVEKVEPQAGKLLITYEKYKLPNGLTLIVHEDHSDPITHVNITYHVGSARELPGKSGFAHFFEHMLFQGSEHVADEEHFKILQSAGGQVNGNTTRDRTVYIETIPSNYTETALWLEADRMGFLLDAVTKEKFEIQRSTVKNEKGQRYDVPYGFLMEVKDQDLYPQGHPYSWPVIGFTDDLDRVSENDLKNFFMRWYGPNNATVIVCGDVNTAEVVKWTEKYFGTFNKCPEVKKQYVAPVLLPQNNLKRYTDSRIYAPLMWISYPGAPAYHKDEAALDVLSSLMAGSRSSVFYKRLVENELAFNANVINNPMSTANHELAGEFAIQLVMDPMIDLNLVRDSLAAAMLAFEQTVFTESDLERVKMGLMSGFYSTMESVESKSNLLSSYSYLLNKPFNIQDDIDRYKNVTLKDVWDVYKKYIKGKYSNITVIEPDREAMGGDAKEKKFISYNPFSNYKNTEVPKDYQNLTFVKAVDNFDRKLKPEHKVAKGPIIPEFFREKIDGGIEVIGTPSQESPMITFFIDIEGGHLFEGKDYKYGTANLLAGMLDESSMKYNSDQMDDELEKIGSRISISSGQNGFSISVSCLNDKLTQTLALLEEKLLHPAFKSVDFKRLKKQVYQGLENQKRNRGASANKAFRRLMFGDENPIGVSGEGDPKTISKLELDDVKKMYNNLFSSNLIKVVVVGNYNKEEILKGLSFLNKIPNKNVTVPVYSAFPEWKTTQIFLINSANAEQSEVRMGYKTVPYDLTGDFYKSTVMNFPLGGNFNSRIMMNLREKNAWTYGVNCGFRAGKGSYPGTFLLTAAVKRDATDSAIVEAIKEINNFRDKGITDEEFAFTKSSIMEAEALDYEGQFQKAGFLFGIIERNLPKDYPSQQMKALEVLTKDEINAIAKSQLKPDQMIIVVVGDAYYIKAKLEKLGYGKVQILDENGVGKKSVYTK